ncbi:MAG: DUF1080 domain-containing protein [Planctomycetales bacterium]|nr:DUF1080 domain-containing protein [Planctomycetales bacterium]
MSRCAVHFTSAIRCLFVVMTISVSFGGGDSTTAAAQGVADEVTIGHGLTDEELAEGWISLFDGRSLFGWREAADANFRVENEAIVVDEGEVGLLRTTTQFSAYRLRLEFQSDADTNSGVFLQTSPRPTDVNADCYELNIAPSDNPFPTGSLVGRQKYDQAGHRDQWRTFDVVVQNGVVEITLDGEKLYKYESPRPLGRGYIGLQHNQGRVAFRKIRLKPLGLKSLFNGTDLAGWKEYPEMASKFSVTAGGELHVENGRGQLESELSFGDFVMQLQCMTHAPRLNSGIFFRCVPGSTMDGYESQIHNGFVDGDRTKPEDCGTGGIFRRQNARFVVANDQEWFHQTIIAEGPHMAAWVNGHQVSDWTDNRSPDVNPRRGLRTEPGTVMIQGHDPTTNISFRGIYAAETAPRNR